MRKPPLRHMMLVSGLFTGLCIPACQQNRTTSRSLNDPPAAQRETVASSSLEPAGLRDLDLGQNWDAGTGSRSTASTASPSSNGSTLPRRPGSVTTSDASQPPSSVWVVVLGTFSGDNHRQAAATMVREVSSMDPTLTGAWVHSTDDGSIVALGRFDSPDDPGAQRSLELVKSIDVGGRPVFARAMLSRVNTSTTTARVHPHALRSARLRYPNVEPLYTLDVSLWIADDDASLTWPEARRRAEAHTAQLRAQGYEAYFHHDDDKRMSTVTVGLFDHRAVDPQSGIFSTDVQALRNRFPARLVNGEPLDLPIDPERPNLGYETQKPFLVLVPD